MATALRITLVCQGAYYVITGVWPIVHIASFMAITGPKVDLWLVKTVGALVIPIGVTLLVASRRDRPVREVLVLAVGAALAFAAIDCYYALTGRISPIYLVDAAMQFAFVAAIGAGLLRRHDTEM